MFKTENKAYGKTLLVIIAIASVTGLFYWYGVKPSVAYRECNEKAIEFLDDVSPGKLDTEKGVALYEFSFDTCLRERGMND